MNTKNDHIANILKQAKLLYHYTSFETIFAILHEYKKNGKDFCLRASNIYNVNDPNEMIIGFDMTKELILKYEENHHIPTEKKLSQVYDSPEQISECKNDYLYGKGLFEIEHGTIPYIVCFSKHKDFLPMWSMYGKQCKGVCLIIDIIGLISNLPNCPLFDFVYYTKKNNTSTIEYIISSIYDSYLRQCNDKKNKAFELATICLAAAPFFKHKDYQYEREFRITTYKSYADITIPQKPLLIAEKKKVETYIPINIPIEALKGIIIGPDANYEVMRDVLSLELKECGLDPRIITKSQISFKQNK